MSALTIENLRESRSPRVYASAARPQAVAGRGQLAGVDEQALHRAADRPLLVEQARISQADAALLGNRAGVEADPLARRRPVQVDREVRVHEGELARIEHLADAVAGVGGDHHALQR